MDKRAHKMIDKHRCSKCKQYYAPDMFNTCKDKNNGLTSWCKDCKRHGVMLLRLSRRIGVSKPGREYRGMLGEKSPLAKLKTDDVLLIRELQGELSSAKVAEKFDVAPTTIRAIWRRESWSHI